MADKVLLMPGPQGMDAQSLHAAAGEFGCSVEVVCNLGEADTARSRGHVAAILFQREALGDDRTWVEAIHCLKFVIPDVRLIPCHGFAEQIDWDELSEAGAFHSLVVPLKDSEVRQSLGFIREAEKRSAEGEPKRLTALPRANPERQQRSPSKLMNRAAS